MLLKVLNYTTVTFLISDCADSCAAQSGACNPEGSAGDRAVPVVITGNVRCFGNKINAVHSKLRLMCFLEHFSEMVQHTQLSDHHAAVPGFRLFMYRESLTSVVIINVKGQ